MPSIRRPRPRHLVSTTVAALCLALGCSREPTLRTRTFDPGEQAIEADELGLDLLAAAYDERQLTVRFVVENRGESPASLERSGILLSYEQLEFPAIQDTAAQTLEVAPGTREQVTLTFDTGTRIVAPAELVLRGARRNQTWLAPLRLPIPPGPTDSPED